MHSHMGWRHSRQQLKGLHQTPTHWCPYDWYYLSDLLHFTTFRNHLLWRNAASFHSRSAACQTSFPYVLEGGLAPIWIAPQSSRAPGWECWIDRAAQRVDISAPEPLSSKKDNSMFSWDLVLWLWAGSQQAGQAVSVLMPQCFHLYKQELPRVIVKVLKQFNSLCPKARALTIFWTWAGVLRG